MMSEYTVRLERLRKRHDDKCQPCEKYDGTCWRFIMPPGHRINHGDAACVLLCDKCLAEGMKVYPWWDINQDPELLAMQEG